MNSPILDKQAPLYEIKANLFKALAHPVRIRLLEILAETPEHPRQVSELLAATGLEASHLSQHLAVLRKHRVVRAERRKSAVFYELAHPKVAELLTIARIFLIDTLSAASEQLADARSLPQYDA